MIYLDTSVVLAHLFAEDRTPDPSLWGEPLVSSRLLEYEVLTRVNARGLGRAHLDTVREVLSRVAMLELAAPVLQRALDPFPTPVRTLDALHLASLDYLQQQRIPVALASYDLRMCEAAAAMGIDVIDC